jgi:hypothetical protein
MPSARAKVMPRWVKSRHTPARSTNVRSAVVSALLTPDPFQHRHDPCHAVAGARELALREAHELVRRTKSAGQQKGQHVAWKIRPQMLPTGFRKQPAHVVFDERHISNIHVAGEGRANSSVAVRRFVGKNLCRRLDVERFRQDRLVACMRRFDVGDDLRCVGETIGELRLDRQFHNDLQDRKQAFRPARLAPWNQMEPDALVAATQRLARKTRSRRKETFMSDEIPPPPVIYDGLDPVLEEKSVIGEVADALKGTAQRIGQAVDSGRKPGMPLSVLSNIARAAPLGSLLIAFLLGVAVARRR